MARKCLKVAGQLIERVQHRNQMQIMDYFRVTAHMAGKHIDADIVAQLAPDSCGLFSGGHKELSCPCMIQCARHAARI